MKKSFLYRRFQLKIVGKTILQFALVLLFTNIAMASRNEAKSLFELKENMEISIKGIVTDESGEKLPGVNIAVKGTSRGIFTKLKISANLKTKEQILWRGSIICGPFQPKK